MPARRTPRWTRAELAILREHYPLGGMKAVLTLLPGRSWYAVHIKAAKLRALILDRVPVRRAAGIVGIGTCSAYRIRDAMLAEGVAVPEARRVGRVVGLRAEMLKAQQIAPEYMMRFRRLVRAHGDAEARRLLRAEIAGAKRNLTFEQKLELVARGQAKVVAVQRIVTAGPDRTLGGVTGAII